MNPYFLTLKRVFTLKIAKSIEKVFGDNIHEFYGTLAYHYEKAENLERTEEYLVKAGEEAMQSGASHEAYNHLKKGLEIYQKLYPVNAEKEKLANYYFNLSLACHRGGLNIEAIENIDQFQRLYLRQLPENKLRLILGLIWRLVNFLLAIHFPKYYFKKKPTELDDILIKLVIIKGQSLVTVNPKLVFFELIYFTSRMLSLDLARTNNGLGMLMESSGLFIWTGISIPFGKKIIHVVEKFIDREKQATWIKLRYDQVLYRLFSGDFTPDADEDEVYRIGLKSGAFWETTTYLFFCTYIHLERGDWEKSCESRKRLLEAAEVFENEHSMVQYYRISGIAFSKFRKIDDMLENSTRGMDMISKTGHVTILMLVQCSRVLALALRGEFAEADKYIDEARNIIITRKRGVIFYSTYLITKIHLEVAKIHSRKTGHYSKEKKKELLKLTNEAIKVSKKYRGNLTEAYRLRGEVLYLSGKHGMALKYYKKAMDFGTKSGSRIETSRTYFHLGKLLSSPDIKRDRYKGFTAADYLEKAITMFEEMDLQWDLAE
jgi:tetratricopeptide (TPR) repeat protein